MNLLTSQGPCTVSHTLSCRTSSCPLSRADCQGWERCYLLFLYSEFCVTTSTCTEVGSTSQADSSADVYRELGGKHTSANNLKSQFPMNFCCCSGLDGIFVPSNPGLFRVFPPWGGLLKWICMRAREMINIRRQFINNYYLLWDLGSSFVFWWRRCCRYSCCLMTRRLERSAPGFTWVVCACTQLVANTIQWTWLTVDTLNHLLE